MTVRIRLQRLGRPKRAYYRIVAINMAAKRDGKPIEVLGQYDPKAEKEKKVTVNQERVDYWVKQGAQPSDTVSSLLKLSGKPA